MRKVIINADDFGMSEAFNHGVIKGFKDGVVSSTSIMVNLPSAGHAAKLSKDFPDLFIGLHTNFVLGRPCAAPDEIPSLVNEDGCFLGSKDYKTGKRKFVYEDVKKETIAQMERYKSIFGHYPEHIEGHSAMDENVSQAFYDIAQEYGIHAGMFLGIDVPPLEGYLKTKMAMTSKYMDIINRGVAVSNFLEDDLNILSEVYQDDEVMELHFHPGYLDQFIFYNSTLTLPRCRDLATLCAPQVKQWVNDNNIELISFGDLKIVSR